MKILRAVGLMLLGGVLTLALIIVGGIHDGRDAPYRPARAALKDVGLSGIVSEAPRAMTLDTHGGFHGDGCCLTVFTVDSGDREALWLALSALPGWHVEAVNPDDYAAFPLCSCQTLVYPAPDTVFDAWYLRDDNEGREWADYALNLSRAWYDRDTGMLFFYRMDT